MTPPSPPPSRMAGKFLFALGLALAGCNRQVTHTRVGVLDFDSTVQEATPGQLGKSLADLLTAELLKDNRLNVIPTAEIDAKRVTGKTVIADPAELGKRLKANYLVLGSISYLERVYVVNASLFSLATKDTVPGTAVTKYSRREEDLIACVRSISETMAYQVANYNQRVQLAKGGKAPVAAASPPPTMAPLSPPPAVVRPAQQKQP